MSSIDLLDCGLGRAMVGVLGWALVHFLWQGALVALMLWCVLALTAARAAQVRYVAACAALFVMVALPVITLARLAPQAYELAKLGGLAGSASVISINADGSSATSLWTLWMNRMDESMPWLMLAWCAGVLVFTGRLFLGLHVVRRLRLRQTDDVSDSMQHLFDRLCLRLQICQGVTLLRSARVHVPTVIGWLKPVVLLPVTSLTGLSELQIEALLAHELAHVRRNDYLVSIMQSIVEAVLFYHPAVWWVSKQVRRERECCCDELAVQVCGDRVAYARALSALEERRRLLPDMALGANGGLLTMRIKRLLGYRDEIVSASMAWVVVLAMMVAAGSGMAVRLAHAESSSPAQPAQGAADARALPPISVAVPAAGTPEEAARNQTGKTPSNERAAAASEAQVQSEQKQDLAPGQAATDREQINQARRALQRAMLSISDVDLKKKLDEVRRQLDDPEFRRQLRDATAALKQQNSPELRQQMEALRTRLENQKPLLELHEKELERLEGRLNSPEFRRQVEQAKAAAAQVNSPEFRKQLEEIRKLDAQFNTPEFREKIRKQVEEAQKSAAIARDNSNKLLAAEGGFAAPLAALGPEGQPNPVPTPVNPVRVSSGVMTGQLVKRVDPVYPPTAKASGVQGTVVLSAIIGKDGTIEKLTAVSGPPMLISSAIEAVTQWQFKPFLLNGQPVEVQTTINVNYSLDGNAPVPGPGPQAMAAPDGTNGSSMPQVIYRVSPEYTQQAKQAKVSGIVTLNLVVDRLGNPTNVHVVRSLEPSLDNNAIAAVEQYRFRPALENGLPVDKSVNLEVRYQLF